MNKIMTIPALMLMSTGALSGEWGVKEEVQFSIGLTGSYATDYDTWITAKGGMYENVTDLAENVPNAGFLPQEKPSQAGFNFRADYSAFYIDVNVLKQSEFTIISIEDTYIGDKLEDIGLDIQASLSSYSAAFGYNFIQDENLTVSASLGVERLSYGFAGNFEIEKSKEDPDDYFDTTIADMSFKIGLEAQYSIAEDQLFTIKYLERGIQSQYRGSRLVSVEYEYMFTPTISATIGLEHSQLRLEMDREDLNGGEFEPGKPEVEAHILEYQTYAVVGIKLRF